MFPPTDNPAQRLLEILNDARPLENHPISKIWGAVFNITDMDAPTCYRILGHLNNLIDSVEIRVRQIDGINHELYLRDLPTIRQIVCPESIRTNWHDIKKPLDRGALTGLEFCANELSRIHSEDKIPDDEIKSIRSEFADIFDQVATSDLSPDLKLVLYDLLTSALLAIDQYRILGNDGLKRCVAYTLGLLTLHRDEFVTSKDNSIIKKASIAIKHLCDSVSIACKVKELAASVKILIQG